MFKNPPSKAINPNTWVKAHDVDYDSWPDFIKPWLFKADRLSQTLKATSQDFKVELLQQGISTIDETEAELLNLSNQALAWTREIYLQSKQQSVVYAKVVAPDETYQHLSLNNIGSTLSC